jgi:hypothetical protein
MTTVLLDALFLFAGLIATATLVASWRRHAPAARALRNQVAACENWRAVDVRISEVRVRMDATVLRPSFTAGARPAAVRPVLPAAA